MRRLAVALVACLCWGCFVADELEKSEKLLEAYGGSGNSRKHGRAEAGEPDAKAGVDETGRQRLADYYAEQRAAAPPPRASTDPKDAIVGCRMRGVTKFMRRYECQIRGGQPSTP